MVCLTRLSSLKNYKRYLCFFNIFTLQSIFDQTVLNYASSKRKRLPSKSA